MNVGRISEVVSDKETWFEIIWFSDWETRHQKFNDKQFDTLDEAIEFSKTNCIEITTIQKEEM